MPLDGQVSAIGAAAGTPPLIYLAGSRFWRAAEAGFVPVTTDLPANGARALAVDPTDVQKMYALSAGPSLLRSVDGGAHWSSMGSDLPSDANSLALGGGGGPAFYLGTAGQGVFASVDGHAWANASGFVNGALPTRVVSAVAFDPLSGDRYVSPQGQSSTGALFAATDQGLFKSIDGGLSWGPLPLRQTIVALAAPRVTFRLPPEVPGQRGRAGGRGRR
jgi:hypothetical protein